MNIQMPLDAIDLTESDAMHKPNDAQVYAARLVAYTQNLAQLPQYADVSWWGSLGVQKEAILRLLYPAKSADHSLVLFPNDLPDTTSSIDIAEKSNAATDAKNALEELVPRRTQSLRLNCAQALLAKARSSEIGALPKLTTLAGVKGRIGALPLNEALRFLRMRALAFRRSELRLCIDRTSRMALYKWLESSVIDQLMKLPGTPQLDLLERLFDMPKLNQLNAEALEWEGLCLLERDGLWDADGPFIHLRLRFTREHAPVPWIKGTIGHDGQIVEHFDPQGSAAVLALLEGLC